MNVKNVLSLLLISAVALTSCKKELEPQESSVMTEANTAIDNTAAENVVVPAPAAPQMMDPSQVQQVGQPQMQQTQPAKVAAGMNPAHGQPGHRCDISVGAPLNSPAGNSAKQVTPQQAMPQQVTPQQAPPMSVGAANNAPMLPNAPVVTAPGMNPPHGQEGHQCSVAVGAPLPKP